jgi:hypothetical protein
MDDLTSTLRTLTADQPVQPADRVETVTRRAKQLRRNRALAATAAAVALLAPAGLLVASAQRHKATSFAHTDLRTWPDRSYAADRSVAEGALASWEHDNPGSGAVHWLFRGTVALPDHDDAYVAVFTATHEGLPVLVTTTTRRSQVDGQGIDRENPQGLDQGISPWVSHEEPLSGTQADHVGLYLEYSATTQSTEPAYRDVLLVLADPSARSARWQQDPLPGAITRPGVVPQPEGRLTSDNGLFVGDVGALTGPVRVLLTDKAGHSTTASSLARKLSQPGLASPPPPEVPSGWHQHVSSMGQSEQQADGSWSGASQAESTGRPGTVAGYVRCYGGGFMSFAVTDPSKAASFGGPKALASGRAPCDGQTHVAFAAPAVPGGSAGYEVNVGTDRLQAYVYVLGSVG